MEQGTGRGLKPATTIRAHSPATTEIAADERRISCARNYPGAFATRDSGVSQTRLRLRLGLPREYGVWRVVRLRSVRLGSGATLAPWLENLVSGEATRYKRGRAQVFT